MSFPAFLQRLQTAARFPHPVSDFQIIETHISWLLLTGSYVYKFKKPVELGFLDFSSLEKRRYACEEEIRINRRMAPDLYVGVVAITGQVSAPELDGKGPVIEYAVKMRQFDPDQTLDQLAMRGALHGELVDSLAKEVAQFHIDATQALPSTPWGEPDQILHDVLENFRTVRLCLGQDSELQIKLSSMQVDSAAWHDALFETFCDRKAAGWVRELHGDLHLGNIVRWQGHVVPFDAIEFNPALRWIDTVNDIAFLIMDLSVKGQNGLAHRFLDQYLALCGDYEGLAVLDFYQAYRAMVRAKVAAIGVAQARAQSQDDAEFHARCRDYLEFAGQCSDRPGGILILTYGVSGSGKSYWTERLVERLPAIRLRSDVERKRLFGLRPQTRAAAGVGESIYSAQASEQTYARLRNLARAILRTGRTVVVDASFLRQAERQRFVEAVAEPEGVPHVILSFTAPAAELRRRVIDRERSGQSVSDAGLAVLQAQLTAREPLGEVESQHAVAVDTSKPVDLESIGEQIHRMCAAAPTRQPAIS
ncbi:MAG: AAA family ATPase [Pseudomonadota bacterium]|nr:AAA family ATPase [Pseudomonadota bacterium]